MPKEKQLHIRITNKHLILFNQYCKNKNIFLSDLITKTLLDFIKNNPINQSDQKKISERLIQEQNRAIERENHKRFMENQYFIKNTIKQLHAIAKACMTNSRGEIINLSQLKAIVKSAMRIFEHFPKEDKKRLKEDVKLLKNWESREWAYNQVKFIDTIRRGLPSFERRKEIELEKNKKGYYAKEEEANVELIDIDKIPSTMSYQIKKEGEKNDVK